MADAGSEVHSLQRANRVRKIPVPPAAHLTRAMEISPMSPLRLRLVRYQHRTTHCICAALTPNRYGYILSPAQPGSPRVSPGGAATTLSAHLTRSAAVTSNRGRERTSALSDLLRPRGFFFDKARLLAPPSLADWAECRMGDDGRALQSISAWEGWTEGRGAAGFGACQRVPCDDKCRPGACRPLLPALPHLSSPLLSSCPTVLRSTRSLSAEHTALLSLSEHRRVSHFSAPPLPLSLCRVGHVTAAA